MKIGFLGGGNMGGALMHGLKKASSPLFTSVSSFDLSDEVCENLREAGIGIAASARELFENSDIIVFAVKPQVLESAVAPYADALKGKFVISIAAGWTKARLSALLPESTHILRVMPNTPALAGCGMTVMCNA